MALKTTGQELTGIGSAQVSDAVITYIDAFKFVYAIAAAVGFLGVLLNLWLWRSRKT